MLRIHEVGSSNQFFKNDLSLRLNQERKLFVAYQKALAMQVFLNSKRHYDSYFPLALIEIIRSQFLDETMAAYLNKIKDFEKEILTQLEKDLDTDILNFLGTVKKSAIDANRLYETLLTKPESLPERELETHLQDLCRLDAHDTLEAIIKKQPNLANKLPELFHMAINSFNLATMKKCVELGLNINEKISLNEFTRELRDFEDSQVTWLVQVILSSEYFFIRPLSAFIEKSDCDIPFTCIDKLKSILGYLLELGFDPDQEIDVSFEDDEIDENIKCANTCRSICKMQIEAMKKMPDGLSVDDDQYLMVKKIQTIYTDVLSIIADAPLKMTFKPN